MNLLYNIFPQIILYNIEYNLVPQRILLNRPVRKQKSISTYKIKTKFWAFTCTAMPIVMTKKSEEMIALKQ